MGIIQLILAKRKKKKDLRDLREIIYYNCDKNDHFAILWPILSKN